MLPMKLGLAYASCFNDPYRTPNEAFAGCDAVSGPSRSWPREGWLSAVLHDVQGARTASPARDTTQRPAGSPQVVPAPAPSPSSRSDVIQMPVAAVTKTEEDVVKSTPPQISAPAPVLASSTSFLYEVVADPMPQRADEDDVMTATETVSTAPPPPPPVIVSRSTGKPVLEAREAHVAATDAITTADLDAEEAAARQNKGRTKAEMDHFVDQELRGGVVARASEDDDRLAEVVDRLYDKIRLNAVQVVALDDLTHQLAQLARADVVDRSHGDSEVVPQVKVQPRASTSATAFDQQELALCLYGLREQVVQMREALVKREAAQEAAQRKRRAAESRKAKEGQRIRVEVVRAYDSPPQPRVKPPFQPAALPPVRKRRVPPRAGSSSRNYLEFSLASSVPVAHTRMASLYHDGSAANMETYSSEDEVVRVRPGPDGRRRRASSPVTVSGGSVRTDTITSSRISRSMSDATESDGDASQLASSSSVVDETVSKDASSSPVSTDSREGKVGKRHATPSESTADTDDDDDDEDDTKASEDTDSSTGADIFWQRRAEALRRKKAREAATHADSSPASSRSSSSSSSAAAAAVSSSLSTTDSRASEKTVSSSKSSSARWGSEPVSD